MDSTSVRAVAGTRVDWLAIFDEAKVLAALLPIMIKCNPENFDRLEAALRKA